MLSYLAKQNTLFSGKLVTTFDVIDLASYITEREDEFEISKDILPMLIGIAFSTTRGYFVRELQDSALASYPCPIVTSDRLLKRTSYHLI